LLLQHVLKNNKNTLTLYQNKLQTSVQPVLNKQKLRCSHQTCINHTHLS